MIYPLTPVSIATFNLIRADAFTRHAVVHLQAMNMLAHRGGAS